MPTEPRTVEDLVNDWAQEAHCGEGLVEAPVFWGRVESEGSKYLIIPLASGAQVVVEKGAWEAAVCRYAGYPTCNTREEAGVVYGPRRDDGSEFDEAWELAEAGAISILSALFPARIVVVQSVGVVDSCENTRAVWFDSDPNDGASVNIAGCRIALLEEPKP